MASDPPCPQKPYKVWNYDKTVGRIIDASKLEKLQLNGRLMVVVIEFKIVDFFVIFYKYLNS